jgi:hypothetical protein
MIADLPKGAMLLADKGYDANALPDMATARGVERLKPEINRRAEAGGWAAMRRAFRHFHVLLLRTEFA